MQSLRAPLSAALFAVLLPFAAMAQKPRSAPAKLPAVGFMGFQLGMTRHQADSITAARGWTYSMTTDDVSEISAGEEDDDGTAPSLGAVFCEPAGDSSGCALVKTITLTFKKDKVSEIDVSSIYWPLDQCATSWSWQKAVRAGLTAQYGKPSEEPAANLKPEMLATLDESKTTASWLFPKAKYGFTQGISISVLHTDAVCWSSIMIWDMSEIYD